MAYNHVWLTYNTMNSEYVTIIIMTTPWFVKEHVKYAGFTQDLMQCMSEYYQDTDSLKWVIELII